MTSCGKNDGLLRALRESLQSYEKQIDILNMNMTKVSEIFSTEKLANIEQMVSKLCNLKHSGKFIKDSLEALQNAHTNSTTKEYPTKYNSDTKEAVRKYVKGAPNWIIKKVFGKTKEGENQKEKEDWESQEAKEEGESQEAKEKGESQEAKEKGESQEAKE